MKWTSLLAIAMLPLAASCSQNGPTDDHVGSLSGALTAAQCEYFDVNGKVTICHKTGSTKNPYTILKISDNACISAHTQHAGDYVAVGDPTCQGGGCLPEGAPADNTVPCCEGLTNQNGTCVAALVPFTCTCGIQLPVPAEICASPGISAIGNYYCKFYCNDQYAGSVSCGAVQLDACVVTDPADDVCKNAGTCTDTADAYTCTCAPGWTGAHCEIDIDECQSNPCLHGDCVDGINQYTCQCLPGWTGTNCDIDIDECESSPCVNGACVDGINQYTCQCQPGWTGTNCDVQQLTCPCDQFASWRAAMAGSPLNNTCAQNFQQGPCGNTVTSLKNQSWLYSWDGSSAWRVTAGFETSKSGARYFCVAQGVDNSNTNCSGITTDTLTLTQQEAADCQTLIKNWTQQNNLTCH